MLTWNSLLLHFLLQALDFSVSHGIYTLSPACPVDGIDRFQSIFVVQFFFFNDKRSDVQWGSWLWLTPSVRFNKHLISANSLAAHRKAGLFFKCQYSLVFKLMRRFFETHWCRWFRRPSGRPVDSQTLLENQCVLKEQVFQKLFWRKSFTFCVSLPIARFLLQARNIRIISCFKRKSKV